MFYSNEILTSRKYGVATVWLVATLGSGTNAKKINRKAILDVDVAKACRTIIDPAAPMALRLQGSLLFGVSKVYLQQCGYVLADAQTAHTAMRMMLKVVKNAALDPEARKVKPEQLILQDDPAFLPELELPPIELLEELNLPGLSQALPAGDSQSIGTPFGSQQQHNGTPRGSLGGLVIPSSSSNGGRTFVVHGDDGLGTMFDPSEVLGDELNLALPEDAGFEIDEDGNIVMGGQQDDLMAMSGAIGGHTHSETGASARVGELEEGHGGEQDMPIPMEFDFPAVDENLPEGEAFPTGSGPQPGENAEARSVIASSEHVEVAPMIQKKPRKGKVLLMDEVMELRNSDLLEWNNNYLANMAKASKVNNEKRAALQAKKNAEHFIWGMGIGGIGNRLPGVTGPTPFDNFYGDNLYELITGHKRGKAKVAGTKHDRDSGIDEETQAEARQKRRKVNEDEAGQVPGSHQIGRGVEDDGMFMGMGDDEIELPREQPSALDDQQNFSAMPWNVSASKRGSSAVRSGVGRLGSVSGLPSSLTGRRERGSRLVPESPLVGRGTAGGLEALRGLGGEDEHGILGPEDFGLLPGPDSDSINAEPETTETSIRIQEALSAEGENFLTFVAESIMEKRANVEELGNDEDEAEENEILFAELLIPEENTQTVAAQGLLMVLALGTKGLLDVRQDEPFGDIGLSLTVKGLKAQRSAGEEIVEEVAEAEDGAGGFEEDEDVEMGEDEDNVQFAEVMGEMEQRTQADDDDHDDLYDD